MFSDKGFLIYSRFLPNLTFSSCYRLLHLDFKPVDFWTHLIARLSSFLKEILQLSATHPLTTESADYECWKTGIAVKNNGSIVFCIKESQNDRFKG